MGSKRGRRVEKVKHGYAEKQRRVRVQSDKAGEEGVEKVVERRVERGYRKGYKRRGAREREAGNLGEETEASADGDAFGGDQIGERRRSRGAAPAADGEQRKKRKTRGWRRVELGYTSTRRGGGVLTPRRHERKARSKPSRPMRVTHKERWGRKGGRGHYRRETTAGRRTGEEARKKELGGTRLVWVH